MAENLRGKPLFTSQVVQELTEPQFYLSGEELTFYGYDLLGFETRGVRQISPAAHFRFDD
jgi:hypothetical protein